jgi:hypothetical protein
MRRDWWVLPSVLLLVGCGPGEIACTAAGMESSVGAMSASAAFSIVRLCVDDTCADAVAGRAVAGRPRTYSYVLTLTEGAGERELRGRVQSKEFFVNGRECPPATANASLVVGRSGTVAVRWP